MSNVYIGLGTNLGDKEKNLKEAISSLNSDSLIKVVNMSSIKETKPVDYLDQPDFLNQVLIIETDHGPEDLLLLLKNIEEKMGRDKGIPKGPRIIDLDILLYDNIVYDTADLKIPHPEILNRKFILDHLIELDPEIVDPVSNVKFTDQIPGWGRLEDSED